MKRKFPLKYFGIIPKVTVESNVSVLKNMLEIVERYVDPNSTISANLHPRTMDEYNIVVQHLKVAGFFGEEDLSDPPLTRFNVRKTKFGLVVFHAH